MSKRFVAVHIQNLTDNNLIIKGKAKQGGKYGNHIEVEPAYSPLKCSKRESEKVCQFPFILNGEVKWDCVKDRKKGAQVCNVRESKDIQEFQDLTQFRECGQCSPSVSNGVNHYQGFRLANHADKGDYSKVDSKGECQTLCDLTKGCNFFNFNSAQRTCHLKYGVGKKITLSGIPFGSRTKKGCSKDILL